MPKNPNGNEQCEFKVEYEDFLTQITETSECCPPEENNKPTITAELMAVLSAALVAAASKSGVWCKNVNQNGVANNSTIYPDYEASSQKLIDSLLGINRTKNSE